MRCSAHNRQGAQCGRWAIRGGSVCASHGGRAPQTIVAAQRRVLVSEAQATLAAQYGNDGFPEMVDPVGELLRHASEVVAIKDLLGAKVAELDSVAHTNKEGTQQLQAAVSGYIGLLRDAGDLLIKLNRLNLGDHSVRVEQEKLNKVADALRRSLADVSIGITHEQQRQVLANFSEEMARIADSEAA